MDIKQYKHIENICNIQQKYIIGEITQEEFFKEIDEENQRHLLWLKTENQKIKQKISNEINNQQIKRNLEDTKVYRMSDIGEKL